MIAIKKALYMTVPLLTAITSCVQANDDGSFTIGLGGRYAPRYSGSDKQVWQVVPVLQGRNGAFFIDTQKGVGYDLQNASGWYFEHTLGYDLGRTDKNASWRAGANNLKGMGDIDVSLNTALAVGWQALSWLSVEGKATLPLTDSQGVRYWEGPGSSPEERFRFGGTVGVLLPLLGNHRCPECAEQYHGKARRVVFQPSCQKSFCNTSRLLRLLTLTT